MRQVKSAELVRYNANNRGTNSPDCVKRAISMAFDLPYSEVTKLLNNKMHEVRARRWNTFRVFEPVIKELGGTSLIPIDDLITVDEFADNIAEPDKAYLLLTGKTYGKNTHMVCILDKKIWDSWDSKDYIVNGYYVVKTTNRKPVTDILSKLDQLRKDYVYPVLSDEIFKYADKQKWDCIMTLSKSTTTNYQIKSKFVLAFSATEQIPKERSYKIEIVLVFQPTMTEDEAIEFIKKTGKQRAYDRMWAIKEQEKKLVEEYKVRSQMDAESKDSDLWLDKREQRFFNSLPGWVRPLITYISIDAPGQFHNSYEVRIRPLPGDNAHGKRIEFWGYDAWMVKDQIERYKQDKQVPGYEYEWDY